MANFRKTKLFHLETTRKVGTQVDCRGDRLFACTTEKEIDKIPFPEGVQLAYFQYPCR
jgi:hypothetical protein